MIIGQNVADACVNEFNALKLQKSHRFVIYKIQNNDIVVDVIGARESTYAEFLTHLPNNEVKNITITQKLGKICNIRFPSLNK